MAESVANFRQWLGRLSGAKKGESAALSRWIGERHPRAGEKSLSRQSVKRWEKGGRFEPDLYSTYLMARKAGVSMEEFCGYATPAAVAGLTPEERQAFEDELAEIQARREELAEVQARKSTKKAGGGVGRKSGGSRR